MDSIAEATMRYAVAFKYPESDAWVVWFFETAGAAVMCAQDKLANGAEAYAFVQLRDADVRP